MLLWCLQKPEEDVRSPRARITGGQIYPWSWELYLGPLESSKCSLTSELSFHPHLLSYLR